MMYAQLRDSVTLLQRFLHLNCRKVLRYTSKCSSIHAHKYNTFFPTPVYTQITLFNRSVCRCFVLHLIQIGQETWKTWKDIYLHRLIMCSWHCALYFTKHTVAK